MPRQPRIQFENACYHVFSRGNRKELIFKDEWDYAQFETMMLKAAEETSVMLFQWKLMPNHFHQLIQTPLANLSEYMARLLTRYACYFNFKYNTVGHVFQGRYKSIVCDKESYFMNLVRYIQLNAYKTKGQPLAPYGEWKWSSHRYLMMPESQWPQAARDGFRAVLERFGSNPVSARLAYSQYLADGLVDGKWEDFYKPDRFGVLGNESFFKMIKQKIKKVTKPVKRMTLRDLLAVIKAQSGHEADDFRGSHSNPEVNAWCKALIFIGATQCLIPIDEMAEVTGRSKDAITLMIRRAKRNGEISDEIIALDQALQLGVSPDKTDMETVPIPAWENDL